MDEDLLPSCAALKARRTYRTALNAQIPPRLFVGIVERAECSSRLLDTGPHKLAMLLRFGQEQKSNHAYFRRCRSHESSYGAGRELHPRGFAVSPMGSLFRKALPTFHDVLRLQIDFPYLGYTPLNSITPSDTSASARGRTLLGGIGGGEG